MPALLAHERASYICVKVNTKQRKAPQSCPTAKNAVQIQEKKVMERGVVRIEIDARRCVAFCGRVKSIPKRLDKL